MAPGESLGKRVSRAGKTEPARPKQQQVTVEELDEEPEPDAVPDPEPVVNEPADVKKGHKDEMDWMQIAVRWGAEQRLVIINDFIREQGLFGELTKFAKRKIKR